MRSPLQITFRHTEPSPALEARIRQRAEELEHFFDGIIACHVVVECQSRHQGQGKLFDVHIDLTLPKREIAVAHDHPANHAHEDPYVAVRDAFDAARRQIEDYARTRRGTVKRHAMPEV